MQPLARAHSLTLIIDVAAAFPNSLLVATGHMLPSQQVLPSVSSWLPISPSFPSSSLAFREVQECSFCSCLCQTQVIKCDSLWVRCENFNLVFQSEMSHRDVNNCENYLICAMNRSSLHQGQRGFAEYL